MLPAPLPPEPLHDRCSHQLRLFFIALQFFTRIPIPRWVGFDPAWLQQSARYFAAVGVVVGVITAAVYVLAALIWTQPVAVLLSTIAGIYLTGAFHEDGFADMCDGFGGGMGRERIFDIMQDSRIGAYGAIGICLLLVLKLVVLASLPLWTAAFALVAAHPVSRLASTALIWRLAYAKAEGKAKPLAQQMSNHEFLIAVVTVVLPVGALGVISGLSWGGIAAGLIGALLATVWLARLFLRRIGGFTGDCLGAVQQMAEVAFYLGLLAVLAR